jgi:hypothetical protein
MKINNKTELDEAIIELTKRKAVQKNLLIQQYQQTTESLRPGNLIKHAFSDIAHSPAARSGILKTAAGLGIGLLTKNLFWGNSGSFVKRLFGNALKFGVAKTAVSNSDKIKAYTTAIYHNLFKRANKEAQ